MPPKKRKDAAPVDESTPSLKISLGDTELTVPTLAGLRLNERFAIRQATGMPAETLWLFDPSEALGQDRIAVWWWMARCRATGVILPLSVVEAELDQAAKDGQTLKVRLDAGDDEAADAEGDDPEG